MYEKLFFLVATILSSYLLKAGGIFKEKEANTFINFVIYFALPLTVVESIRNLKSGKEVVEVVGFAWGVILFSFLLSALVGRVLKLPDKTFKSFVLVCSLGNTAFLGYPYAYAVFGDEGLRYAILYDQLGSFLAVITLGLFVSTGKFSLREVLTFPPFWGLVAGFLLIGREIPSYIDRFLEVSADSLIPVILFSLGLKLDLRGIRESITLGTLATGIKMVVVPLGVLLLLKALGLNQLHHRVILLESSMPAMVMSAVIAIKYGLDERLAVSAVMLGVFASFFTVPIILSYL